MGGVGKWATHHVNKFTAQAEKVVESLEGDSLESHDHHLK